MTSLQAWTTSKILNDGGDGSDGATHPCGNPLDGMVFAEADGFLMVTALFRPSIYCKIWKRSLTLRG